ncbi:MAG: hypothetical protein J7502_01320, partial [Flavisolibacter sp.]|nr:hypothetical protein [Flavisolibacter sp.]
EPVSRQFFHYKNIPGDENSLPHNSVRSFYMDKGAVWLGCYAGGLRKYDRQLFRFGLYRPLISDPVTQNIKMVFSFAEMKNGDMLIGSDGGGLNIFHKKDKSFSHFDANKNLALGIPKEHAVLRLLVPQKSDGFWAGSYGFGLSHYNPATKTFTHYLPGKDNKHLVDASVFALMEDSKGNIWVGLNNGLNVVDPKTKTFSIIPTGWEPTGKQVNNLSIRCFYEMDDGKIWIGTHGSGISVYDPVTKTVEYIDKTNSHLSNNVVFSIYRDRKGNLWVGTMGGINLYNEKTKTFTAFTESNGLPNDYIASIQEDTKGNLWLSTKKGISCFNPVTKKVRNYGLENGLQAYEFLFGGGFTSSTGEIYFGGIDGFNVFDPATIPQNQFAPPVVITGFQLFNKPVTVGENSPLKKDISIAESITLPFGSSMLSLEFAALNFTAPEKNQYAYQLEGFDKDWIYSGNNRVATYTNLDPGEYTFMVKASNNDGVWNEKGASIKIIITPPFWLTWWFKLIAGVLLLGTVYVIYKIRMRSINQHREQLEKQVQERTQSLAQMTVELERKNKELEQFAYVASHDLQEPLRTISSFLDLLSKQYADHLDERAQKYMIFIVQASDRMKVLINDLLDYSRIGRKKEAAQVDLNKIVGEVLADLNKAITDAGAEIQVGKMPVIKAYPTELKQVFQNLILNAIKFRKKDTPPKIEIAAERQNGEWKFMVRDNGIGIDPQHADRIFVIFQRLHTRNEYEGSGIGLSNCKKIAELHKGTIWVESAPGEGSSFFFTVKEMDEILS